MDPAELQTLKDSIAAQGLIQAIAVRPKQEGRYYIVAGHRRVEAFRQLLAGASTDEARARYATIPAVVKLAIDDARLAAMAFAENKERAGLTLLEEGKAMERMLEAGLAHTNEELATLTGQPARTVQRLRRLARAPRFLAAAIDAGLMVVLSTDAEGREKKELRRLDLMPALQFLAMYEQLCKSKPQKVAEARTEATLRRAMADNWSLRRIEEYVQDVVRGKRPTEEPQGEAAQEVGPATTEAAIFEQTPRRFVVDVTKLRGASPVQLEAVRAALDALLSGAVRRD
jgi:ParB/RepB/Spo0J family partition protein